MARFRPLRWLGQAVRAVFRPSPQPPAAPRREAPPTRRPVAPVRRPEPRRRNVARFYTRDAPTGLTSDYTVNQLVDVAWLNPDTDPDLRIEMRGALRAWVRAEHGLRFDDYFDWEAWRREMGYT